jgi:hypothetical protein
MPIAGKILTFIASIAVSYAIKKVFDMIHLIRETIIIKKTIEYYTSTYESIRY